MSISQDNKNIDKNVIDKKVIKALAFDLDGTILAPGAVLTDRTIKAVKDCMRRGLKVIIATGRAIEAAERYRAPLGAEGPMVYYNGAVVADMPEGKILQSILLDTKAAEFCVDLSRELNVYCQLYLPAGVCPDGIKKANKGENSILQRSSPRIMQRSFPHMLLVAELDGPELEMYHKHTGILAELCDLKKALKHPGLEGCVKAMFLAEPEVHEVLRQRLEEQFGENVYIARTARTFLEVMNPSVSKGQALKFAMERLSLKSEEVIAFGDEENDLPMFKVAGFSVVPSSAKETVKIQANLVVGSNADDGVAVFLEEFF